MIKINNQQVDLVLQVEDYTNVQKIFNCLNLDINEILIICPELFFQRFIQSNHEGISMDMIDHIESIIKDNNGFVTIDLSYKYKLFHFHFIVTSSETQLINNPLKGDQELNIGFKIIKTN